MLLDEKTGVVQVRCLNGIDKLTAKSPFRLRFVFAHKIQLVDYHSYLFFNRV